MNEYNFLDNGTIQWYHEYYKANIGLVVKCVRQRVAVIPTVLSPAHIEM